MKRTHTVEPLPDCPCREVILASRNLCPDVDIDESKLFRWRCPIHDPAAKKNKGGN